MTHNGVTSHSRNNSH